MQTRSEAKRTMASRFDPHRAAVKGGECRLRNTGYMPQSSPYQSHRRRMAGAGARISRASAASPDGCQPPERLQHAATWLGADMCRRFRPYRADQSDRRPEKRLSPKIGCSERWQLNSIRTAGCTATDGTWAAFPDDLRRPAIDIRFGSRIDRSPCHP